MELTHEFLLLLQDIAYAVKNKEAMYIKSLESSDNLRFIQNHELEECITRFHFLMLKYNITDEKGMPIAPKNETDMLINYLSKPLKIWPIMKSGITINLDFEEETLINLYDNKRKYYITDLCRELAMESSTYNLDFMQRNVYNLLSQMTDKQYRICRKWIIEHPIIDRVQKLDLENYFQDFGISKDITQLLIKRCYEVVPIQTVGRCLQCGWTISRGRQEKYCIDRTCRTNSDDFSTFDVLDDLETYYRLNRGVMYYFSFHGRFEVELNEYCMSLGIESQLWPNHDSYDLQIISEKNVYAIDLKNYRNPYQLKYVLQNKDTFKSAPINAQRLIIVPDERFLKEGYARIVEDAKKGAFKVMKLESFKMLLKKEVGK